MTGLDLGARVLAFVWEIDSSDPDNGIGPEWEVRLHRVAGAPFVVPRDVVVGDGFISGGCGSVSPASPNAAGSAVVYLQQLNNCEATAGGTHSLFVNARGGRRPDRRVEPFPVRFPVGEAFALAYDRGTAYWLYGTTEDSTRFDAPCVPDGCPLVVSPLLPFADVPGPDLLLGSGEG